MTNSKPGFPVRSQGIGDRVLHSVFTEARMITEAVNILFRVPCTSNEGIPHDVVREHPEFKLRVNEIAMFYRETTGVAIPVDLESIDRVTGDWLPSPRSCVSFRFYKSRDDISKRIKISFIDRHGDLGEDERGWLSIFEKVTQSPELGAVTKRLMESIPKQVPKKYAQYKITRKYYARVMAHYEVPEGVGVFYEHDWKYMDPYAIAAAINTGAVDFPSKPLSDFKIPALPAMVVVALFPLDEI